MNSPLNRLATQKSPYLLQHKENPVDWYPWGDEAFARARAEDKPIFLSIGYSTCHWCHVMEHESFVDEQIAQILNTHFISIKVDREERPDVDHVYMTFIQATTGHGGWPMSVWLTPDLKPFFGGTYFAPKPAHGRPSFAAILERIAEQWKSNRSQIVERGESLLKALKESEDEIDAAVLSGDGFALLTDLLKLYQRLFDSGNGGFGSSPKFPRCVNQELLLFAAVAPFLPEDDRRTARGMALHTLHSMSRGGINDHLAGGFHRYSVDAKWHVPHFEKMLYDQAQLVSNFVIAYQLTGDSDFSRVVHETLRYVSQDLSGTDGSAGFFSAEDADSLPSDTSTEKLEGAFYVWKYKEASEALGEVRWRFFNAFYDLEADGNVAPELDPHEELAGQNILHQQLSLEEAARRFGFRATEMEQTWKESRAVLLARRGLRPRPLLDDKVLTSWNGLMIAAYAQAYCALGESKYLETAKAAATFLKRELFNSKTGEIQRSYRQGACDIPGFASDYAGLIHGLIELYQADFDIEWLVWAEQLQFTMDRLFWDEANGGYYSTTNRDPSILLRMKEDYDGAEPTPSSLAARNLWRLGHLLNNSDHLAKAKRTVDEFRARLQKQPYSMPLMVVSAGFQEMAPQHLILHVPEGEDSSLQSFLELVRKDYQPNLVVIRISTSAEREHFSKHEVVTGLPQTVTQTTAYLCRDYSCQLPVTDPAAFTGLAR